MASTKIASDDLAARVVHADLPPVTADVLAELIVALGGKPNGTAASDVDASGSGKPSASATSAASPDVEAARTDLAHELRRVADGLGDLHRRPYETTLLGLASATLAEAHRLDRGPVYPPCRAAHELVSDVLRRTSQHLRGRVRRFLLSVVDGVATEGGRRAFVTEARALLARARRWRPACLDMDNSTVIRLGGRIVSYRSSRELPDGSRALGTVTLAPTNLEGRFLLLAADGRAPEYAHPSVVSRVSGAVTRAPHGVVKLVRDTRGHPSFEPPLELTRRAKRLAQTVRSLHIRPRAKRNSSPKAASSPPKTA